MRRNLGRFSEQRNLIGSTKLLEPLLRLRCFRPSPPLSRARRRVAGDAGPFAEGGEPVRLIFRGRALDPCTAYPAGFPRHQRGSFSAPLAAACSGP